MDTLQPDQDLAHHAGPTADRTSRSLRVGIDGYNLALEKGTGIFTYARNLSYALRDLGVKVDVLYGNPDLGRSDPLLREISFFDPPAQRGAGILLARRLVRAFHALLLSLGVSATEVPITGKIVSRAFTARMPYFDRILNVHELFAISYAYFAIFRRRLPVRIPSPPDIMHWTYPLPIKAVGARNIYTIHDLVPLKLPYTTLDNKRYYKNLVKHVADQGDLVVTVSETSRQDIIDLLGVAPGKVVNLYQSVDIPEVFRTTPMDEVALVLKSMFRLEAGRYLLFVGAIEPKKNIGRLIEAYLGSGVDLPLVIVGPPAWKAENELVLLNDTRNKVQVWSGSELITKERIMRLHYVSFPQLMSLIRGARALLFPSLYEGFGLPVLEAMTLGTPVMTSSMGSLPEIAGDAALIVDPYSVPDMRAAIRRLASDDALTADLSRRGPEQAKRFDQHNHMVRLARAYADLLGPGAPIRPDLVAKRPKPLANSVER